MKNYYRVMLGSGSTYASACFGGGFIGVDFGLQRDLTKQLPDAQPEFNREFIPVIMSYWEGKTKIGAGLACGAIWTVSKGIVQGDIVLCPDGTGVYRIGIVVGDYEYAPGEILQHRRPVRWFETPVPRSALSESLQKSAGSIGTVSKISGYAEEIERLIGDAPAPPTVVPNPEIEDPVAFAMEKHLEAFLVANWDQTELSQDFRIFEEDGETVGQQYQTDSGPLDILAVSRDGKRLLVVELKRGRASDVVVGQILRYMGYVQSVLAEADQTVEGVIIALEDDPRLQRALQMVPAIRFYRYQVSFKLMRS